MPVDQVVAVAADHEGLAADLSHELGPFGLRLAGPVEDGQRADVVNRDVVRSLAELASSPEQPGDQLPVGVDGPGVLAVGEDRVLLPLERNAAEPGDQRLLAPALDAGLKSRAQPI